MFKCHDCGRFISYADLDEKRAFRKLIYPNSAYTQKTWKTVCAQCIANALAEDAEIAEIAAEDAEIERLQAALEESLSSPRAKEGK